MRIVTFSCGGQIQHGVRDGGRIEIEKIGVLANSIARRTGAAS